MVAAEVEWRTPALPITLLKQDVHLWRIGLSQPDQAISVFSNTLSIDEHERANRFYFQHDRRRFIVSRGGLRTILSFYLNCAPHDVQFQYGQHGKPALRDRTFDSIQFNVSHSHELAVYAITHDRKIGIDLEHIRLIEKRDRLAQRFFSVRENEIFCRLPESNKSDVFFHYWTCKEAYVKAVGVGLSLPTSTIEVALEPDQSYLLSVAGDRHEASQWTLKHFVPEPNYIAALAVEGHDNQLLYWNWPEVGL
jgi:4'-phosphopantetheinyl transferase